jgi:hypothetical protein
MIYTCRDAFPSPIISSQLCVFRAVFRAASNEWLDG